jgi:hypothetical protein
MMLFEWRTIRVGRLLGGGGDLRTYSLFPCIIAKGNVLKPNLEIFQTTIYQLVNCWISTYRL